MKRFLLAASALALLGAASTPEYAIEAIRYASLPGDSVADLVIGAPGALDPACWLSRSGRKPCLLNDMLFGFGRAADAAFENTGDRPESTLCRLR
jgi:hypothetical protein